MKALDILREIIKNRALPLQYTVQEAKEAIAEVEKLMLDNQELKIMELEAHQYAQRIHLKHKELESYCEEQKNTWESQENGNHKVYEKILKRINNE